MSEHLISFSFQLTKHVVKTSASENNLKEELKTLKKELYCLNMVDEFPKYARTERKINKLKSEIQLLGTSVQHFLLLYYDICISIYYTAHFQDLSKKLKCCPLTDQKMFLLGQLKMFVNCFW